MDWVQLVCLRDPACAWTALRAGFGVLQDAWKRFQRKHPIPATHVVVALGRSAADSGGEHVDPLGLFFLSQHPGLESVTKAFKEYMAWCKGRHPPKDAYHDTSRMSQSHPSERKTVSCRLLSVTE